MAALVRPDHYLFGTVTALDQLPGLVADLQRQLGPAPGLAAGAAGHGEPASTASPA